MATVAPGPACWLRLLAHQIPTDRHTKTVPDSRTPTEAHSWDKGRRTPDSIQSPPHIVWGVSRCFVPSSPCGLLSVGCEGEAGIPEVLVQCLQMTAQLGQVGRGRSWADGPPACLPISNTGCFSAHTDASFGTSPGYGCVADRAEEQRRHQEGLPYIDDSPSSSPHLSSKGRGSRDALASGALESTKAVSQHASGRVGRV